jgi:anti-sigma28 factor (negative regulator of flagellin synthesis)
MWGGMASDKQVRKHPTTASVCPPIEVSARALRIEELRRLVARGAYKVDPQRLALRILVKATYSPEKRT